MSRLSLAVPAAFLTIALVPLSGTAQPDGPNLVTASFTISDPRGEFDDNTDTGFGFTGAYMRSITPNGVVSIGLSGSFLGYGSTSRLAPLSNTIPDILVEVDTQNSTAFALGTLEIAVPGRFQPYVQATGGGAFFYTTTSLEDTEFDQVLISDTNHSDQTWVWGGGGGLRIRFWESSPEFEDPTVEIEDLGPPPRAYVDFGVRYLKGSEVEYLKEGSLVTDDGEFEIDRRLARSEIEMVQYQIGLTVRF